MLIFKRQGELEDQEEAPSNKVRELLKLFSSYRTVQYKAPRHGKSFYLKSSMSADFKLGDRFCWVKFGACIAIWHPFFHHFCHLVYLVCVSRRKLISKLIEMLGGGGNGNWPNSAFLVLHYNSEG